MSRIEEYLNAHPEFSQWIEGKEQGRVELKILPYLKNIENGFFVEAGALDGLFMSNTKILEDLGWNGLLIEPSPKAYRKCKENRGVMIENCALVSKFYPEQLIIGDFFYDGTEGKGAWSSVNNNSYLNTDRIVVNARTLADVFTQYRIKKVDFLSLDVEGYELNVLKGIDFIVDISYILIEINMLEYSLQDVEEVLKDYQNLGCISNFSSETTKGWNGVHQDYLFKKV